MPSTHEQIMSTYRRMAEDAQYRPAAPGDGLGNIAVPAEELILEDEADRYAQRWKQEEDNRQFHIGCCNYPTRPATILVIEAARSLCAGADGLARDLLHLALADLGEAP